MDRRRLLSSHTVELLVVAVVGGALALIGAAVFGKLGSHTTIQQVSPLAGGGLNNASLQVPANPNALTAEQIYKHDAPGVVQITATTVTTSSASQDPFNFLPSTPQVQRSQSLGSGFVIDKAGHIVTNYHVIQGSKKVQVSFSGQDEMPATVVGADPSTDLAVLKIDAHARALNPLQLGNSDAVTVGDSVYAIGNPFGFVRTLTTGVVSAVQRQIEAPNSTFIDHAIQTDAAINHGNSGGPLLDLRGRVIGVTSQISTGTTGQQGNLGIGFAIPVNTVRSVAAQIIANGKVLHAFLGLDALPVTSQLAQLFHLPTSNGLLIQHVQKASGADKAGLKAGKTAVVVQGESYQIGGDIITEVDGQPISSFDQLRDAVSQRKPGDKLKLTIYHNGSKKTVTATLGQRPNS
ncbi:MAG TPA: trypsin-like peptidase domain-containing protein [Gaiellaceae bacterium]|nr:trypsin-like peptidase domain-containing protein [Gaiellaceae bacterium]